jgi:chromosomal replication initiation ATPase DnaA
MSPFAEPKRWAVLCPKEDIELTVTAQFWVDAREEARTRLREKLDREVEPSEIIVRPYFSPHGYQGISAIIKETALFYGLSAGEVIDHCRGKTVEKARGVAMFLSRTMTEASFPEIGAEFDRDHSTVMRAVSRIEEKAKKSKKISRELDSIRKQIRR